MTDPLPIGDPAPGAGPPALLPPDARRRVLSLCLAPAVVLAGGLAAGGPPPTSSAAAARAAADRVQPGRPWAFLQELQARHPSRSMGTDAWREAPAFIASALAAAGAEVRLEVLQLDATRSFTNVLARIPGVDRTTRVVLAAHHDTVAGAPGAIDDGGAVAVQVEVARALAAGPPPPCDVEVAVFDLEEKWLRGSRGHLAALPPGDLDRVRAAVAVELVGWKRDRLVLQTIPWGFAVRAAGVPPGWLPATVRAAAADAGVPVGLGDPFVSPWYQGTIRVLGVVTGSDADAYLAAGAPSALLTGSALTNFYEAYHTPRDDLPLVDPARLDDAARAAAAAVVALAGLDPAVAADRRLGEPYLALGGRTLGRWALLLLGLAAALAPAAAGLALRAAGAQAGTLLLVHAGVLALLALLGSVVGLVVAVPSALGLALACAYPGVARPLLYLGMLPALAEVLLVIVAASMFGGFRWAGGPVETPLLLLAILGGGATCSAVILARSRLAAKAPPA